MHEPSPAWPHGPLRELFADLFFVIGTNRIHHAGLDLQTSRTMLVVRHGRELSLINTVRLSPEGLAGLEALGTVKHLLRLGAFHGRDDPFYRKRYDATLWAPPGSVHGDGRDADRLLSEGDEPPLAGARLFTFVSAKHPEAALWLDVEGGMLVTGDAIQNWQSDAFFSAETFAMFSAQGLIGEANIPSTWLGACEPRRDDFERLLSLPFRHLVSAHGEPLLDVAHERVRASVLRAFSAG